MILSACFASKVQSQIDIHNLNKKLLEHEIKTLIDSTRIANKLPPLFNDSILYLASNHHSNYLVKKGALSHEEIEYKEFLNPQDRAVYYGAPASYLVGENVAYTVYNNSVRVKGRTFVTTNYTEIARSLVFSWINSKGHFQNIIDPDYQITGLSIGLDTNQQRIYACQKFARVIYKYNFKESITLFPYSNLSQDSVNALLVSFPRDLSYPFNLRYDKKQNCEACKEVWSNRPTMSVRVSNNYFILRVEDADFVKELIKNRKDGFAIEIVPFDAFACGNPAYELEPSRRNGLKRTSGRVLEPVYRNDLINGFKRRKKKKNISFVKYLVSADSVSFFKRFGQYKLVNFDAKYFEIKLGKVPKDLNTWWNHNLMYIHDKQICHFMFLTNYPGELNIELLEVPYYPPVPKNDYEFQIEYYSDTLELYYGPGETTTTSKDLDLLIKRYQEKNLRISKIKIDGFCSVEGDEQINETLHQKRAQTILDKLNTFTNNENIYTVESQVAWDHFYASVKNHSKWKFLYPMTKEEIQIYLRNPKNERPLEILSQERKVKVSIEGVRDLNTKNAPYYIARDMSEQFYRDKNGRLLCRDGELVSRLYEKAYYFSTVDTLTVSEFLKVDVPVHVNMSHRLQHDLAFYRYHYLKDTADKTELSKLKSKVESVFAMCGAAEHLSPEFHYLSACFLVDRIKQRKGNTPENPDIQKAFDRLNMLLNWYELDSVFRLNVAVANLNIINILCETIDPDQLFEYNETVNTSLVHIVEYYRNTNQLNPERVIQLGKFLCYFKNIPLAVDLCHDFLYDNEVLKLYLPLAYSHSSYLTSDDEIAFEREFHQLLLEAKSRLSSDEWCKLFFGEYGIPFQVMDNEILRNAFCETCPNRVEQVLAE